MLAAALLTATDLRAQPAQPVAVCIGRIEFSGFEERRQRALHRKLVQQLLALGADIPAETHGLELEQSCLADPECVKETMADLDAEGVLHVRVRRVGPLAWIGLDFYDARSGMEIFSSELTAPMREFPEEISFDADLAQGIEALRQRRPQPSAPEHSAAGTAPAGVEPEPPPLTAVTGAEAEEVEGSVLPLFGWGGLGLGVALLAGGAVTGGLAIAQDQELSASCVDKRCPPQLEDELVRLSLLTAATDVLLVAGGVSAVAGIVLLVLGLGDDDAG